MPEPNPELTPEPVGETKIEKERAAINGMYDSLRTLRGYSDEVPEKILHSTDGEKPPELKVRHTWFASLVFIFVFLLQKKEFTPEMCEKIRVFNEKFSDNEFKKRRTTAEDIVEANKLIDEILDSQKGK